MAYDGRLIFSLTVLGGFQLRKADQPIDLPARKLACLLTYLACTAPLPQSREKLATLLWGSSNDERARHNLRQALSRLRQVLGPEIFVTTGEAINLAPGVLTCDANTFCTMIQENSSTSIAAAANLYGGHLLEDILVDEAGWNDWLIRERERLSEQAIGAMVRHGETELASGDAVSALSFAQRAVGLNSFREDAHRLVLRSLAATGRASEAVRHFQALVVHLAEELDTEPDEYTRSVFASLGKKDLSDRATDRPSQVTSGPAVLRSSYPLGREFVSTDGPPRTKSVNGRLQPPALAQDVSQRRQVTVLVCGLAGLKSDVQDCDPEKMALIVKAFQHRAADVAAKFGGYVAPSSVETIHMWFGFPQAHEDDALRAVRAGLSLVNTVSVLDGVANSGMGARVGISTGLVVIGNDAGPSGAGKPQIFGDAPVSGARLAGYGAAGDVVVSRRTRLLLGQIFDLGPIEATSSGTDGRPVDAWRVLGERDEADHQDARGRESLSPLVGRQEESDLLLRRWTQAKAGTGRVVCLSGEPGIGKSRLSEELWRGLDIERPTRLRYQCSPQHRLRPLHPFITQFEGLAGFSSAKTPAEKTERLSSLVGSTSTFPARDMGLLTDILMLPEDARYPVPIGTPSQKREMFFAAFLEWLEVQAAQRPILMLVEDIHWIDPTSLDLLDRLIGRIATLPILMIITLRPEHKPSWIGQSHVTMLHLGRLERQDSAALIIERTKQTPFPQTVIDWIVDRADGVPLFVSELTKQLMESELVRSSIDGAESGRRQQSFATPVTLHSSLIARLDLLGDIREVAVAGSVIGRNFSFGLIAAVLDMEHLDLQEALERIVASGLFTQSGAPPISGYSFSHALICDVAYGMLVLDQRRRLHSKVADELIAHPSEHPEYSVVTIAHHLSEAGRTLEAVRYWVEASRAALKRWANRESAEFLELALAALDSLPDSPAILQQAIDLRFEIKNALIPLGKFDVIIQHLLKAQALIEKLDDPKRLCQFFTHMCQSQWMVGKSTEAIQYGREALRVANALGDLQLLVEASVFLGTSLYTVANYPEAEHLFQDIIRMTDGELSGRAFALAGFPGITARAFLIGIHGVRGDFEDGILYGEDAVARATQQNQPYTLSLSLWCLADLHLMRGDIDVAIRFFEKGLAISKQWDLPFLLAAHSGSLGLAQVLQGHIAEGLPSLERAVGVFERMNHQLGLALFMVPLAQARMLSGQLDKADELARRAIDLAHEGGNRSAEASALRVRAEAASLRGDLDQALDHYRNAISLAEKAKMRPLIAHCYHGLGELQARLAQPDKAQESLGMASRMYREMQMWFWLEKLETVEPARAGRHS